MDTTYDFIERLSTKEPVPGGGGAGALMGATAAALCSMQAAASAGTLRILKAGLMNQDLSRRCSAWISRNTRSKRRRKTAESNAPWRAYISYQWATANAMR